MLSSDQTIHKNKYNLGRPWVSVRCVAVCNERSPGHVLFEDSSLLLLQASKVLVKFLNCCSTPNQFELVILLSMCAKSSSYSLEK